MNGSDEEIELAELQRALLDEATLDALLGDVEALCIVEAIAFKEGAEAHAGEAAKASLAAVKPALAQGIAVQIRYAYRGELWIDTLLPGLSETLLVRMRQPTKRDERPSVRSLADVVPSG